MMWTACCTGFSGLLRCSEFPVPSSNGFEPVTHLSLQDATVDNKTSPSLVRINVKQSKTDPFHKGFHLLLKCTSHHIRPVKALLSYLTVHGSKEGSLFITEQSFPSYKTTFSALSFQEYCILQGWKPPTIIPTFSTLAQPLQLSRLAYLTGRWQSNAYETYINTPREQLAPYQNNCLHQIVIKYKLLQVTTSVFILSLVMYFYRHKTTTKQELFHWVAIY